MTKGESFVVGIVALVVAFAWALAWIVSGVLIAAGIWVSYTNAGYMGGAVYGVAGFALMGMAVVVAAFGFIGIAPATELYARVEKAREAKVENNA